MPSKYHPRKNTSPRRQPASFVSMIAQQPDDRPDMRNMLVAKTSIKCPAQVLYTPRPQTGMGYSDKMAAVSSANDSDHGNGLARTNKDAKQAPGYTARIDNPHAKQAKGISTEAANALANSRAWAR